MKLSFSLNNRNIIDLNRYGQHTAANIGKCRVIDYNLHSGSVNELPSVD